MSVPVPIVGPDAAPCGSAEGVALLVLGVVIAVVMLLLVFVVVTHNGLVRRRMTGRRPDLVR